VCVGHVICVVLGVFTRVQRHRPPYIHIWGQAALATISRAADTRHTGQWWLATDQLAVNMQTFLSGGAVGMASKDKHTIRLAGTWTEWGAQVLYALLGFACLQLTYSSQRGVHSATILRLLHFNVCSFVHVHDWVHTSRITCTKL